MVSQYEKSLDYLRGPLALRMTYELGDYYAFQGQTTKAKEKLLALTAVDRGQWGNRSRLQLADMALQDDKPNECVRLCREVIEAESDLRDAALKRMGKALSRQGKYASAAECFAGRVPPE